MMTNVLQPAGEGKRKGNILVRSSCLHLLARGRSGGDECRAFSPSTFCGWNRWGIAGIFFPDACPISATMGRHFAASRSVIPQRHALLHPISPFAVVVRQNFVLSTFLLVSAPLPSASLTGDRPHSLIRPFRPSAVRSRKERKKETLPGKNTLQAFSLTRPHNEQVRAPS